MVGPPPPGHVPVVAKRRRSGHCESRVIVQSARSHYLSCGQAKQNHHMQRHSAVVPVIVALVVAIVGQGIVLFGDFGPDMHPLGTGMITAAAVSRAGAVEIPTGKRLNR
jgi:hypothetical protein